MLSAQWYCVVITILKGRSPLVTNRAEMVSIRHGVLADTAAQIPSGLHPLLGSEPFHLFKQQAKLEAGLCKGFAGQPTKLLPHTYLLGGKILASWRHQQSSIQQCESLDFDK